MVPSYHAQAASRIAGDTRSLREQRRADGGVRTRARPAAVRRTPTISQA